MCGIVGMIGARDVAGVLLDALRRLEYRGYDSAGIATLTPDGALERRRAEGKLSALDAVLHHQPLAGHIGIGHTRWATHGAPNTVNAHPHMTQQVAVVHNGIIENFETLRAEMQAKGHVFESATDTEVVPILLTDYLAQGFGEEEAFRKTLDRLDGAYALGVVFQSQPKRLFAARRGSPLAIGVGQGEMYIASDAIALAPVTNRICYLEEGDSAILTVDGYHVFDKKHQPAERPVSLSSVSGAQVGKGNYRHFMLKEIHEQPMVMGETLSAYYNPVTQAFALPALPLAATDIQRVFIIACGTSYYAAMVAKYWMEQCLKLPVEVDIASEFRYREPVYTPGSVMVVISQSGETADTLAALRHAKAASVPVVAVVNVPESTMAREANAVMRTYAGPEIGVASTKAFTAQLMTLACLTMGLADARGSLPHAERQARVHALAEVPAKASEMLDRQQAIEGIAQELTHARDVLYLGRGTAYPLAMEGALKLKEISYIHAEGYAAGELKHGPIALIDENVPVIVVAPDDGWFDKTTSNLQEVVARGGKAILLSSAGSIARMQPYLHASVTLPRIHPFAAPILYALPIQLLAYHTAVQKGTDVDQPRNLAKSVTVE